MKKDIILDFQNVTKAFPGVVALEDVTLQIERGEIHGLCGENGAGKSTLMKILSGVYPRDSGQICLNGASARLAQKGDIILILAYCHVEDNEANNFLPRLVYVDSNNRIVETRRAIENIPF